MEHIFTPNDCKKIKEIKKVGKPDLFAPSKQSLALIMQFAATYHVEKNLSLDSLSGIILN